MAEDLNLSMESGELDFSDYGETPAPDEESSFAGESMPGAETVGSEGQETAENAPSSGEEAAGEKKHKVLFLGKERELTDEELLSYAQKGLNYDHVASERDRLRDAPEIRAIEKLAAASGMDRARFLEALEESARRKEEQALVERGATPELAERMIRLERESRERAVREAEQAREHRRREAFQAFVKEYPDVTKFPDEVAEAIAGGETPLNAYRAYEVRQLKGRLATLEHKEQSRKKAIGAIGDTAAPPMEDDFLSAFGKE